MPHHLVPSFAAPGPIPGKGGKGSSKFPWACCALQGCLAFWWRPLVARRALLMVGLPPRALVALS